MSLNICRPDDIRDVVRDSFYKKRLIPLFGAGVSVGMEAQAGCVPDGATLRSDVIKLLCAQNPEEQDDYAGESLQSVFGYFDDDEMVSNTARRAYYKEHFTDVTLNAVRRKIFDIDWPYIYTLNIDDSIEKNTSFKEVLLCNRKANDEIFNERKCVIKLHGDIHDYLKYQGSMKVFSAKEYAESLRNDEYLLEKFKDDCCNNNIIIIGCSLSNEYDLLTAMNVPFAETREIVKVRKICCTVGNPSKKTDVQVS